jgi:hypothetical protein
MMTLNASRGVSPRMKARSLNFAGAMARCAASGPSPAPPVPWQPAQFSRYSACPRASDGRSAGEDVLANAGGVHQRATGDLGKGADHVGRHPHVDQRPDVPDQLAQPEVARPQGRGQVVHLAE